MGFAPVFNIPLISDIFFLIFALKKDCNKIFILLQPLVLALEGPITSCLSRGTYPVLADKTKHSTSLFPPRPPFYWRR